MFNTVRPVPGTQIAVFGAGTVGLAAIMAARNSPATRIIAVDRNESRLRIAAELGATNTVNAAADYRVKAIHDLCGGPADYSLECTGVISVVRQAADSVEMLGTCLLIGGAPAGAEFSLDHLTTLWGKRMPSAQLGWKRPQRRADDHHHEPVRPGPVPVRPPRPVLRPR